MLAGAKYLYTGICAEKKDGQKETVQGQGTNRDSLGLLAVQVNA